MDSGPRAEAPISSVGVSAYTIPTDLPESDGTLEWDSTTLVLAELQAGGETGLGYTYSDPAAATLIAGKLARIVEGRNALDIPAAWAAMVHETRNLGRPGITSMAIAAVDTALWDLKGKLLDVPVAGLLGKARTSIPVYGSGGFTSYDDRQLADQLGGWARQELRFVKMKVSRDPGADLHRLRVARSAIGNDVALFIDSNGALGRKEALRFAETAAEFGVEWFEEPVSSNDLDGLRLMRDRAPAGMAIAAGEYGFDSQYFRRMLEAGTVDILQADATRCAGITGFMKAAALAEAHEVPLSAHCAPALHLPACLAAPNAVHMEWFHDHVRIESLLFDGAPELRSGAATASPKPGLGLVFKHQDAASFRIGI